MNVLSLFDGISTGRLALEKAGISVHSYYSSEIDENAIKISQKNWPDIIRLGDVQNLDIEKLPKIDLLIGGSPCQGFSRNGNCLNFDDPRSKLFFVYADILKKLQQKNPNIYFLLENVIMKKEWRDVISETLGVEPIEINSSLLSAQNRPRQYWTNIKGVELPEDKNVCLIDILENINLETVKRNGVSFATNIMPKFSEAQMDLVSMENGEIRIKQAVKQGYIVAEPGDGVNLSFPGSQKRRGRAIKRKTATLDTNCEICVYTGEVIRHFTMTELERLQTLPDGYTKCEGVSDAMRKKAIGNGWTTDVIVHIFKNLKVQKKTAIEPRKIKHNQNSKKMTYICSPCRGDYEKNIIKAQEYCREAILEGLLPIAPHVYFTQFVDDTHPEERKLGLLCGLQLLRYCQLIRVYGCRVSSGMFGEIQLAGVLGIEIQVFGPPEFVECVMEIYDNAKITQKLPAGMLAATPAERRHNTCRISASM